MATTVSPVMIRENTRISYAYLRRTSPQLRATPLSKKFLAICQREFDYYADDLGYADCPAGFMSMLSNQLWQRRKNKYMATSFPATQAQTSYTNSAYEKALHVQVRSYKKQVALYNQSNEDFE